MPKLLTWILIVGGGSLLLAAISAYLCLTINPFTRNWGLPPITRNLPLEDFDRSRAEFSARVQAQLGSLREERALLGALEEQGFEIDGPSRSAQYTRGWFPCAVVWMIVWTADSSGQIQKVTGTQAERCL